MQRRQEAKIRESLAGQQLTSHTVAPNRAKAPRAKEAEIVVLDEESLPFGTTLGSGVGRLRFGNLCDVAPVHIPTPVSSILINQNVARPKSDGESSDEEDSRNQRRRGHRNQPQGNRYYVASSMRGPPPPREKKHRQKRTRDEEQAPQLQRAESDDSEGSI